jgi:hypothetical protein
MLMPEGNIEVSSQKVMINSNESNLNDTENFGNIIMPHSQEESICSSSSITNLCYAKTPLSPMLKADRNSPARNRAI